MQLFVRLIRGRHLEARDRSPRASRVVAAAVILVLGITACGTPDPDDPAGAERAADGETLASFMGWEGDDEVDYEARFRDEQADIQERIRACMVEQGFEYIPVDNSGGSYIVHDEADEEERVRSQGLGITTWYGEQGEQFEPDFDDEGYIDPNWERVEAMSESERDAYYAALHGTYDDQQVTIEVDPETGEEYEIWEGFGSGCEGEAHEAVYGGGAANEELWEELGPAFEEMYERVQADPRIVEHNEAWSRCMAEAGYEYRTMDQMHQEVYDDFHARLEEIIGPDGGWSDPFEGWSEQDIEAFFEEKTQDEIDAFFQEADRQRFDNVDQEALVALQQEEIALAVADFECRDGTAIWELYEEVSADYEAEFIEANRDALERLRDAESR